MELLLDVDLSILGRAPSLFDSYDRAIRAEYQFVPDKQYREARTCILSGFLNREFIYHTDDFRRQYEQQARANLHWAIAQLRK
jgi:predicted metal-dependent HD superfamily phosphohydrolase